jgi:hypothetical protein
MGLNFTVDYESSENAMIQYFGGRFRGQVAQFDSLGPNARMAKQCHASYFPFPQLEQTTDWMKCSHILVMSMTQKYSDPALMQIIQSRGTRSLEPSIITIEWPCVTLPLVVLILVLGGFFLIEVSKEDTASWA